MVPPALNITSWKLSGCKELILLSGTDIASISQDRKWKLDPFGNFSTLLRIVQKYLGGSRAQGARSLRKDCGFLSHYTWNKVCCLASRMIVGFIHYNRLQVNQEFLHLVLAGDSKDHERVISKEDYNAFIRKRDFWEQAKFASCEPFLSMDIEKALSGTDGFKPEAITNSSFDGEVDYESIEIKNPGEAYFYEYFQSDNDDANNEESGEGSSSDDKGDGDDEGDNANENNQAGESNEDNEDNGNNESEDSDVVIVDANINGNLKRVIGDVSTTNIVISRRTRYKTNRFGASTNVGSHGGERVNKQSNAIVNGSEHSTR